MNMSLRLTSIIRKFKAMFTQHAPVNSKSVRLAVTDNVAVLESHYEEKDGNMLNLTAQRETSVNGATLSRVYAEGVFICDMLEDEVREVPGEPVASWKIKGKTAILAGRYRLSLEYSNRFGPNTLTVNDVEGFTGIRCHGGNTAADTEGCLVFGIRNSENTVANSQAMLKAVRTKCWEYFSKNQEVYIDIKPAAKERDQWIG